MKVSLGLRAVVAALVALTPFYLGAPHASAPPGESWGFAELIEAGGLPASSPKVSMDAAGNAVAVWTQVSAGAYNIYANRYTPGAGWGSPVLIENVSGDAQGPEISANANGEAFVVWQHYSGVQYDVWANRYVPGIGWGIEEMIESGVGHAVFPSVGIDTGGNAIAVWRQTNGLDEDAMANRYTAGVGWGTAVAIEASAVPVFERPWVAVSPNGDAVAVWRQGSDVWANTYVQGVGWGTAELAEADANPALSYPVVAIDTAGRATAAWPHSRPAAPDVMLANRFVPGTGWGTAQRIDTSIGDALTPAVAVDGGGNAIAVWTQTAGFQPDLWASRYVNGSGWGAAERLESDLGGSQDPSVALDSVGNATLVWSHFDGANYGIRAIRYEAGTGWGVEEAIGSAPSDTFAPSVAVDPNGTAVAVWQQLDGSEINIWSNRYGSRIVPAPPTEVHATLTGEDVNITWTPSNPEDDVDHYEVWRGDFYDRTAARYVPLPAASNLPKGTGGFVDTTTIPLRNHFYVVWAVGSDAQVFGDHQVAKFRTFLTFGANLVSLPLDVQDASVAAVFASVSNMTAVRTYDPWDAGDPWKTWSPGRGGEFTDVNRTRGYWVNIVGGSGWTVAGRVPKVTTVDLLPGWNLVAYGSFVQRTAGDALASISYRSAEEFVLGPSPYRLRVLDPAVTLSAGDAIWIEADGGVWQVTN